MRWIATTRIQIGDPGAPPVLSADAARRFCGAYAEAAKAVPSVHGARTVEGRDRMYANPALTLELDVEARDEPEARRVAGEDAHEAGLAAGFAALGDEGDFGWTAVTGVEPRSAA
jgi:hypothetical protein